MIPKCESPLKAAFTKELRRQCPNFYVLLYATAGAPDREIVGASVTTRWEMKHATPGFASDGNQELFCARLAAVAHCRYVLWWESSRGVGKRTMIVHPLRVLDKSLTPEIWTIGFDHNWLVQQVKKAHGVI